jgi:hypothetical protein
MVLGLRRASASYMLGIFFIVLVSALGTLDCYVTK